MILILGGTGEANALAHALGGRKAIVSLAGRTGRVPDLPCPVRVGGFGGTKGLADFLRAEGIKAVVDATHPFAARISAQAAEACAALGVRRLMLVRPPWSEVPGDNWIEVPTMAAAAEILPSLGRRAFLTVGVQELAAFAGLNLWMLARAIGHIPPGFAKTLLARGPFAEEDELALMRAHAVDVLVTKASGGAATYGKIAAARHLGLPVLMVARPPLPPGEVATTVHQAVGWLGR